MVFKAEQQSFPGVKPVKKLRKKAQLPPVNSRRAIIFLFSLTVLASLFFYLRTEVSLFWQKIKLPAIISTLPEEAIFDPSPVLNEVEGLTRNLRGTYGLYVYRLDSGESYGVRENEVFTAASLIKLPVMLLVYQEGEKGSFDLDQYRSLVEAMGKRSDNAAFNRLVEILGEEKIQKTIDNLGMKKTSFAKNDTTPADVGLFFRRLYRGGIISDPHREELFDFLTGTIYEDRIPAGLPEGVRVAHKIGTEIGSFSDAGIIFAEKPFILVIMADGARESEANEVLPQITRTIWEFESQ